MSIPTITSVSPSQIYSGGQMITITGAGFRTKYPVDPATPHPWPAPNQTVSVLVGGRAAERVVVDSATSIRCVPRSHAPGAVEITVQNLDTDGLPIVREINSASGLLTFVRADLTVKSDLVRLIESLVTELRNQVIANVSTTTSVDFDSDPDRVSFAGVDTAKLPAICLVGPDGETNRPYNTALRPTEETDAGFDRRATFEPQDLRFKLLCLDNHGLRELNLFDLVTKFFKVNDYVYLDRDPNDSSKGWVQYELEGGPFVTTSVNNDNDLRAFSGPIVIKGFQFEDVTGFPTQSVVEHMSEAEDFNVVGTAFSPS